MQGIWEKISGYVIQYGVAFITAIFIFVIGKWVARLLSKIVEKTMEKAKVHKTVASFTKNIVYYVILLFVAIAALNKVVIFPKPKS